MNIERWNTLLRELGLPAETRTFSLLQSAYAEGHRAYHTARHIDECLSLFDELKQLCRSPAEVECALWFHDAIYEPMSKSNEERSADWAAEFISSCGAARDAVDRIRLHVLATRHDALPDDATPEWSSTSTCRFSVMSRVDMTSSSATLEGSTGGFPASSMPRSGRRSFNRF